MDFLSVGMSMSLVSLLALFSFLLSVLSYYGYFVFFYCILMLSFTNLFVFYWEAGRVYYRWEEREELGRTEEGDTVIRI